MKNMEGLVAFARLALVQRAPQQTQRGAARICSRIHQRIPLSQQPQRGAAEGAALKEGRGAGPKREGKQEEQLNAPEGGGGGGEREWERERERERETARDRARALERVQERDWEGERESAHQVKEASQLLSEAIHVLLLPGGHDGRGKGSLGAGHCHQLHAVRRQHVLPQRRPLLLGLPFRPDLACWQHVHARVLSVHQRPVFLQRRLLQHQWGQYLLLVLAVQLQHILWQRSHLLHGVPFRPDLLSGQHIKRCMLGYTAIIPQHCERALWLILHTDRDPWR